MNNRISNSSPSISLPSLAHINDIASRVSSAISQLSQGASHVANSLPSAASLNNTVKRFSPLLSAAGLAIGAIALSRFNPTLITSLFRTLSHANTQRLAVLALAAGISGCAATVTTSNSADASTTEDVVADASTDVPVNVDTQNQPSICSEAPGNLYMSETATRSSEGVRLTIGAESISPFARGIFLFRFDASCDEVRRANTDLFYPSCAYEETVIQIPLDATELATLRNNQQITIIDRQADTSLRSACYLFSPFIGPEYLTECSTNNLYTSQSRLSTLNPCITPIAPSAHSQSVSIE